jgi:transcriptional regulator with XRE-family HTH domain
MNGFEKLFYVEMGRIVTAKRKQRGLSQTALARRVGIHRNTLNRWLNAETHMPVWMILRIADALSCNHLILLPGREFVWRGGQVEEFRPERPKPPEMERPVQFERDPALTAKERVS